MGGSYNMYMSIQQFPPYGIEVLEPDTKYKCTEYTHLITLKDSETNNNIIINKTHYDYLVNVLTLSTNTDLGRNLIHDSYIILCFKNNLKATSCVQEQ